MVIELALIVVAEVFTFLAWIVGGFFYLLFILIVCSFELVADTFGGFFKMFMRRRDESGRQHSLRVVAMVGAIVFGAVVVCTIIMRTANAYIDKTRTEQRLITVATGFAKDDKKVVNQWAEGKHEDSWGNDLTLDSDDGNEVQFRSAGPDKESGTKDDIIVKAPRSTKKWWHWGK